MTFAPAHVAIALGSNLGDRRQHLDFAVARLSALLSDLHVSTITETAPFDVVEPQPFYLNAVAVGATTLDPDALLAELMSLELARGRTRPSARAARTLDLDLILYGDRVINRPELTVPHPRFRDRRFVLDPLAELAPDWVDPVSGKTVAELLEVLMRPKTHGPRPKV